MSATLYHTIYIVQSTANLREAAIAFSSKSCRGGKLNQIYRRNSYGGFIVVFAIAGALASTTFRMDRPEIACRKISATPLSL
jgi:hypothetical protein